eukprot:Em0010g25a
MKNVSGSEVIVPSAPVVYILITMNGKAAPKVTLFDQAKALFSFSAPPRPGLNAKDKLSDELQSSEVPCYTMQPPRRLQNVCSQLPRTFSRKR